MPSPDHVLTLVLLRIGASNPKEVELQPAAGQLTSRHFYRALCGDRWAYVDRALAIKLRERGAVWSGELVRDPCAVA